MSLLPEVNGAADTQPKHLLLVDISTYFYRAFDAMSDPRPRP